MVLSGRHFFFRCVAVPALFRSASKQFTPTRQTLSQPALERRFCTKTCAPSLALTMAFDMALALLGVWSAGMPEHTAELSRRAPPRSVCRWVPTPKRSATCRCTASPCDSTRRHARSTSVSVGVTSVQVPPLAWISPSARQFLLTHGVGPKVLQVDFSLKLTRFQLEPELAEAREP